MERPTDTEAQETLGKSSPESLETAMWLVRNMNSTVDEMRMAQDEMMSQWTPRCINPSKTLGGGETRFLAACVAAHSSVDSR